MPGQHEKGGWSQARYERHIDNLVAQHLREVVDTLEVFVRRLRGVPVVLVGGEEIRSEFESLLSKELSDCVAGWTSAEAHADASRLLEVARPVLEEWSRNREDVLVDRWREAAATNGRGASGWEQTLEAASDGRVDLLLVQEGVDREVYQCPKCGRAQTTGGGCPLDGTTLELRENGVDVAVHRTLAHGGTVQVLRDRDDLESLGVAALLRY